MRESSAGLVVSQQVRAEQVRSTILLAGQVNGTVETVLDTPRALLAGLASGVAVGLVLLAGNLLSRKEE
ncbi:MAG: hypothetical protein P8074_18405 [Anaerolineales bacterium]